MIRIGYAPHLVAAILAWALTGTTATGQGPPAGRYGPGGVYANVPPIDDRGRDQLAMFNLWNPDPIANHERNLAGVRPDLAAVIRKALADNPGIRFVVGSGRRSAAQQAQAERWSWSPPLYPGARSVSLRKHLDGLAVDLWPLDEGGRVTFSAALQARVGTVVSRAARDLGTRLSWGGAWRRKKDPTHFELIR